ncbi:MAG: TolC family protein, partial [Ekhidna sp.]
MKIIKPLHSLSIVLIAMLVSSCVPELSVRNTQQSIPNQFNTDSDTTNISNIQWGQYFDDAYLVALIDTALQNNQELNIFMREMEMLRNEVQIRKGEYLPFVDVGAGAGLEKPGKYTRAGAVEESLEIREGQDFPEPLGDFMVGAYASWEVDVWKKLRTAKKSALTRYLASIEGRNFLITNLVSEIARAYY